MTKVFNAMQNQSGTLLEYLRKHWSIWMMAAVLLAINLPVFRGAVRTELIFRPEAVQSGQWWRIVTHPLVHLTWYHLLLDAGGFLLLYSCLAEQRKWARWIYIVGPGTGALLMALFLDPSVSYRGFCGLSGIAHGLMAVTALEMLGESDKKMRIWGAFSLATVILKSGYELYSGQVFFEFMHMGMCGHPIAASHGGGVLGGLLSFALIRFLSNRINSLSRFESLNFNICAGMISKTRSS